MAAHGRVRHRGKGTGNKDHIVKLKEETSLEMEPLDQKRAPPPITQPESKDLRTNVSLLRLLGVAAGLGQGHPHRGAYVQPWQVLVWVMWGRQDLSGVLSVALRAFLSSLDPWHQQPRDAGQRLRALTGRPFPRESWLWPLKGQNPFTEDLHRTFY